MAQDNQRSRGRSTNYRLNRGGNPAEFGPFYGIVKNTTDSIRSGRIQVYITAFGDGNEDDSDKWTWVSYLPSFFGSTPYNPSSQGFGSYVDGNSNSYGMWFTPPDLEVTVLVVFANGDRSQGFYIGVVPDQSIGHMVPAVGASAAWVPENENQKVYFKDAVQLPVVEINTNNLSLEENPKFFDKPKPIQAVVASTMFSQGLINDTERGPITSSSQRESPSAVFGWSTPGMPIYQGGLKPNNIQQKINAGEVKPQDVRVIGRTGGHSLVMDDGDINGDNRLLRLRTISGHQITMSDSGDFIYIVHANGLSWVELGKEGTVDVYAANSVNLRTQGDFNFHADRDINLFAGRYFNAKSMEIMNLESQGDTNIISKTSMNLWSQATIQVKADGALTLDSASGSWAGGSSLVFKAGGIDLNGPDAPSVTPPEPIVKTIFDDTKFSSSSGWQIDEQALESVVSRAPTHEPWPDHNTGVDVEIVYEEGQPAPPPGAIPIPPGVEITRIS